MPTGSSRAMGVDSSSDGGADDNEESSESERDIFDMLALGREGGCCRRVGGKVDEPDPRRREVRSAALLLPASNAASTRLDPMR
jgi:hypothetical protein